MKKPKRIILQFEYVDDFEVTKEDAESYARSIGISGEIVSTNLEDDEMVNGKIARVTIIK